MASKYLYGAGVQGIQNFIFETSKLSEIAGASELVEKICTDFFKDYIGDANYVTESLIIGAAGNIKYIFDSDEECQRLVHGFPKFVMNKAPGITISQAVIELKSGFLKEGDIDILEKRLRIQRNRPIAQHGLGFMISERSRKTGKAGIAWEGKSNAVIDLGQKNKEKEKRNAKDNLLQKIIGKEHPIREAAYPNDIADIIADKKGYSWIAVVHADGNNLGKLILQMSKKLKPEDTQAAFREFSLLIESATSNAASKAYYKVVEPEFKEKLPIRPVILGGDDLTVIIRGDLAMPFTNTFLKYFEEETKKVFKPFGKKYSLTEFENGLTACAGIAYIKWNYPFHYGVKLCEELCKHSKKVAKDISPNFTPSCLTFHKVQSSFISNYDDIIEQELETENVRFNYGPYFTRPQEGYATVDQLTNWVEIVQQKRAPKSSLRNWIGELQVNEERAKQNLERIVKINSTDIISKLNVNHPFLERKIVNDKNNKEKKVTHIFDVLTMATIQPK